MSDYKVNLKVNNGKDCSVEDIRIFQKHLKLFHSRGVTVHDENGHYFTVDDEIRNKIDQLVIKAVRKKTFTAC